MQLSEASAYFINLKNVNSKVQDCINRIVRLFKGDVRLVSPVVKMFGACVFSVVPLD